MAGQVRQVSRVPPRRPASLTEPSILLPPGSPLTSESAAGLERLQSEGQTERKKSGLSDVMAAAAEGEAWPEPTKELISFDNV